MRSLGRTVTSARSRLIVAVFDFVTAYDAVERANAYGAPFVGAKLESSIVGNRCSISEVCESAAVKICKQPGLVIICMRCFSL